MNIWALHKDISIKHLLLRLQEHLGAANFIIEEQDPLHDCGIYLQHISEPQVRAYVFTLGQATNRYGVQVEYPPAISAGALITPSEDLSLKALIAILAAHLDIAELYEPAHLGI